MLGFREQDWMENVPLYAARAYVKDFGTKTHFFSKKKWEKVRFRAILSKKVGRVFTTQPTLTTNIISVNPLYDKT